MHECCSLRVKCIVGGGQVGGQERGEVGGQFGGQVKGAGEGQVGKHEAGGQVRDRWGTEVCVHVHLLTFAEHLNPLTIMYMSAC